MRVEAAAEINSIILSGVRDPHTFPTIPLLEQTVVLIERDGGLTECFVPTNLINHEEVPVKADWAESLARQMRARAAREGGTGQKTPIQLGWIAGESAFRIVDGFHRDAALVANKEPMVFSTVEHTDWNKLFDDRIITAKDHAHVRFSRVVRWMKEVWEHSGMSDELNLEQALLLYRYDSTGAKLDLTTREASAVKAWVAVKEQRWEIPAMTIHGYLQTAERVDPQLVNAVREKKNNRALEAPTQQIIKTFSEHLPDDFDLQNLVWEAGQPYNLTAPHFRALCDKVRGQDFTTAKTTIANIDVAGIEPAYGETKKKQTRRASDPRYKGATALDAATKEIERVNERVRRSIDRGEEVDAEMKTNLDGTLSRVQELQTALGSLVKNIAELKSNKPLAPQDTQPSNIRQITRKAYLLHQSDSAANVDRTPNRRNRTSVVKMDLPSFGKFYAEDWASLEPHHRFALVLEHPDITSGTFETKGEMYIKALELAHIVTKLNRPKTVDELRDLIRAQTNPLVEYCPFKGTVITVDRDLGRPVITPEGKKYLAEVVKNALIAIDASH